MSDFFKEIRTEIDNDTYLITVYDNDDNKKEWESYYFKYEKHKEDGPAWISYRKDGTISEIEYFVMGKRHRENGPSHIVYQIFSKEKESYTYYFKDKLYSEHNYYKMLLKKKLMTEEEVILQFL